MPKAIARKNLAQASNLPSAAQSTLKVLQRFKLKKENVQALLSEQEDQAERTHQAILHLKSHQAISDLNLQTLSALAPEHQLTVAKGLTTLKTHHILNGPSRELIANPQGDFLSLNLGKLKKAQLYNDDTKQLIVKHSNLSNHPIADLIIFLQRANIKNYLEIADIFFSHANVIRISDLIQNLSLLAQKKILSEENAKLLLRACQNTEVSSLMSITKALETLADNAILNLNVHRLIKYVPLTAIWDLCDILLRLQTAECLNEDIELVLAMAFDTLLASIKIETLRLHLIHSLEAPYFKRFPANENKILLCSLLISLPKHGFDLLRFLESIDHRNLLTDTNLLLIFELGFKQAAQERGHLDNIRKLGELDLQSINSPAQLLTVLHELQSGKELQTNTSFSGAYQAHGMLRPPAAKTMQQDDIKPEPMDIDEQKEAEERWSMCGVM